MLCIVCLRSLVRFIGKYTRLIGHSVGKPAGSFTCVMCALPGSATLCSREFPLPLAFFLQSEIADFAGRAGPSYLRRFSRAAAGPDERTAQYSGSVFFFFKLIRIQDLGGVVDRILSLAL